MSYNHFPYYQFPSELKAYEVCPHCRTNLVSHRVNCDGNIVSSWHCKTHGDVFPMKSAVVNYSYGN